LSDRTSRQITAGIWKAIKIHLRGCEDSEPFTCIRYADANATNTNSAPNWTAD
jgi:hypothetical protein